MLTTVADSKPNTLREIEQAKRIRKTQSLILVFSMGSQFDHLILMQLAKLGIFALIADPARISVDDVRIIAPRGIIVSGGPASVHSEPPPFDNRIFDIGIPIFGICLGFQMWAKHVGAKVRPAVRREFGVHSLLLKGKDALFNNVQKNTSVLQSHGDSILPHRKITTLGSTDGVHVSAGRHHHLVGVQFHPEVRDTKSGLQMFANFCFNICGITDPFPAHSIATEKIAAMRRVISKKRVLIALSGGTDSSVVAYVLKKSLSKGTKVRAIYIKGIDRPDDEVFVRKYFGQQKWMDLKVVDATNEFLQALSGKKRMHEKRVAMRGVYKKILENEISMFRAHFIAQGTLHTDLVESGHGHTTGARRAQIKLHHNTALGFSVPELTPLDDQVKDSARSIGRDIGVPEDLLVRHPFPGPGLVVRIEDEVNAETLRIARAIDGIYIHELRRAGLYEKVWQAGAVVTRSLHTVSKGDDAGVGRVIALWAFSSDNVFTAQFAELPYDFLKQVSQRITNEIREVGAIVYRISDKPPTTVEWG